MRFYTHILFALFLFLLVQDFTPLPRSFFSLPAVLLFSIITDLDTPNFILGRRILPLSFLLKILFGHRKFFHSFLFLAIIAFPFFFVSVSLVYIFLLAAGSHLLLDALTPEGIMPFYPMKMRIR